MSLGRGGQVRAQWAHSVPAGLVGVQNEPEGLSQGFGTLYGGFIKGFSFQEAGSSFEWLQTRPSSPCYMFAL